MIVMKFGGSSVESASAIQRVAAIVRNHREQNPAVVVSAMGKTTDALLAMGEFCAAGNREAAERELAQLKRLHMQSGGPASAIDAHFDELEAVLRDVRAAGKLTPVLSDAVLSFGERLSSLIVTAVFRHAGIDAVHLDSRDVIVTDRRHTNAAPLFPQTNALLRRRIFLQQVTVMGGFIGATEDGVPTTLGRGGSDYTAAIVGAALSAEEIQIWTDVDGMLTCDPRIVSDGHCLRAISYAEAEIMARAGAKVLHPATVLPAIRQRIPITIRNSRNPDGAGTRIVQDNPAEGAVMSIACKTGVSLIHIRAPKTPVTSEFGRSIWEMFQESGVAFELMAPAVKRFSLVVETTSLTLEFVARLSDIAELEIEDHRAVITLVGHNASCNAENLARAASCISSVACESIPTSCADSRFGFVVSDASLGEAAQALHDEFFSIADEERFVLNRRAAVQGQRKPAESRPLMPSPDEILMGSL